VEHIWLDYRMIIQELILKEIKGSFACKYFYLRYFFSNFVSKCQTNITIITGYKVENYYYIYNRTRHYNYYALILSNLIRLSGNTRSYPQYNRRKVISRNRINFIISLQKKKVREQEKLFVIEGDKIVKDFLFAKVPVKTLVAKPEFLNSLPLVHKQGIDEIIPAGYDDLKKVSSLKTPHNALAVVRMPDISIKIEDIKKGLTVALDFVQDPGNLGTIIRSAAWFGIKNIYCSENCVDIYNPKVIQASMGSILYVKVHYTDLHMLFRSARNEEIRIYGAVLEGESIYSCKLGTTGIIFLGNESKGISDDLIPYLTDRIMIPRNSGAEAGIDSLNVGMAASVIFSEFTRSRGRML